MSFSFLYKWALVLGLLLGHVVTVFAQDANMDRAKHVYELFVADQGDSIHALLNKNLQEKLSPEILRTCLSNRKSSSAMICAAYRGRVRSVYTLEKAPSHFDLELGDTVVDTRLRRGRRSRQPSRYSRRRVLVSARPVCIWRRQRRRP